MDADGVLSSSLWVLDEQWEPSFGDQPAFSTPSALLAALKETNAGILIVDLHESEAGKIADLASPALPIVVIDDLGLVPRIPNLAAIVSAQAYADAIDYSKTGCETILRGPTYFLIPADISPRLRSQAALRPNLLLTFGGGQTHGVEHLILEAVLAAESVSDWHVQLVVGSAYPDDVPALRVRYPNIEILQNIDNMPHLMNTADAAFCAAGDTVYELLAAGVPTAAVAIADNQQPTLDSLAERGAIISLGRHPSTDLARQTITKSWASLRDTETRETLSAKGIALIDGKGAKRVAHHIAQIAKPTGLAK